MLNYNLQLFGGRGSSSGPGLPGKAKGVSPKSISKEVDVWSYRHKSGNEPFVDAMNESARTMQDDFPDLMESVQHVDAATLKGRAAVNVLGYYGDGRVALNTNYTDIEKMN